jgi:hypothetical protein
MALSPGYILENVHNRNWAIITNDNDGDDVISGTDADENAGHKVECFYFYSCSSYLLFLRAHSGKSEDSVTENTYFGIYASRIMPATSSPTSLAIKRRWLVSDLVPPNIGVSIVTISLATFIGTYSY